MSNEKTSTKAPKFTYSSKKKFCVFCSEKIDYIDYKNVERLKRFMTRKRKNNPS